MKSKIIIVISLIENLLKDIHKDNIEAYILRTRIDRILLLLNAIEKEGILENDDYELKIKYSNSGGYGGGSYITNLNNIVKELNDIKNKLLRK